MHALSLSGVCFAGSKMVDVSVLFQGPCLFLASVVLRSACVMGDVLAYMLFSDGHHGRTQGQYLRTL
jgi:hypothetical protein